MHDLRDVFGITNPICEGCPPGQNGCLPSTSIDNEGGINLAEDCYYGKDLGLYFYVATVTSTTRWSKHCSPCVANP
jgi:hypothetical protein